MKYSSIGIMLFGVTLAVIDLAPGGLSASGSFFREAQAIVGRPLTPLSVAGVARRTTRRVIATSIYVPALPPAATIVVIDGVTLYQSGTTYYRVSGNQYVVVNVH